MKRVSNDIEAGRILQALDQGLEVEGLRSASDTVHFLWNYIHESRVAVSDTYPLATYRIMTAEERAKLKADWGC